MRVDTEKLKKYLLQILIQNEADPEQATIFIDALTWSDEIERPTHGLWRFPIYFKRFKLGLINCPCNIKINSISPSLGLLDGDHGFGHYVGSIAMNRAIELAKNSGVGVIGVHNSNHFGVGGYFVNLAAEQGMLGIAVSNSTPKMAPHGGIKEVFGTNPFSFAAPRQFNRSILIDMATSASSGAAVMRATDKLPEGIAVDYSGNPITDPSKIKEGSLLPFGGAKGYGLALMIEILSGVITGAGISHGVNSMFNNFDDYASTGHFFIVINIEKIMSIKTYYERIEQLIEYIKSSTSGINDNIVLLPGENRWKKYESSLEQGINLDNDTINSLKEIGDKLNLKFPI
jgi:LDH2 family malate/lactate/ureidoglycolate dehydrogenase